MTHLTNTFTGIGDAPSVLNIQPTSDRSIRVTFTQQMNPSLSGSAEYTVNAGIGSQNLTVVTASVPNPTSPQYVDLLFNNEMTTGVNNYTLVFSSNIKSSAGDSISPNSVNFSGYGISPYIDDLYIPTSLNGSATDNIRFKILDSTSGVQSGTINVDIRQDGGGFQQAIITGSFTTGYNGPSSSITPTAYGFQVVIDPTGSLAFELTLRVSAQDNSNNQFSASFLACDDAVNVPGRIVEVPQAETLVLHWDFENVTGSGNTSDGLPTTSDAKFIVEDKSSGSLALVSKYQWLGPIRYHQYPGQGDFYLPYDTDAVQKEYVPSAKQLQPEVLNSANLVEIRTQDDDLFTRESRPIKHFYAVEKSPYGIISEEMMKMFATITDFNNLIGEPVNRYRQNYKDLEKLRSLYFERTKNSTIDFEKFVDYFKWFDSSISQMLQQLVPASANFSDEVRTIVESHILERNKYWTKFPTLEIKASDPEGGIKSINELLYSYASGSAPIPLVQSRNAFWWKNRAERTGVNSSGNPGVDSSRTMILSASLSALNRSFTTPVRLGIEAQIALSQSIDVVNITNIKNSVAPRLISASVRNAHVPVGKYAHDYEIIQTAGRLSNNRFLVKSNGTASLNLVNPLNNAVPFTLTNRSASVNEYIFANTFASPGEPKTMSRGYLDQLAEEYSVYNNMNYRNSVVRNNLNVSSSLHTEQFGLKSGSQDGNYHKVNRNVSRKLEESGSSIVTASIFDNNFLTRPIPQSDLQYGWIKESAIVSQSFFGYGSDFTVPSGSTSVEGPRVQFISGSDLVSVEQGGDRYFGYTPVESLVTAGTVLGPLLTDFAGMNYHIYEPVSGSENTLGYPQLITGSEIFTNCTPVNYMNEFILHCVATAPGRAGVAGLINALFLHRNGPYQYPTWKQIRTGEHPVAKYHKRNNIISIMDSAKERIFLTPSGDRIVYQDRRSDTFTNYVEPPVSFRYRPLIHTLNVTGSSLPVSLRHTYANNLAMFANAGINNQLGVNKCDDQMYDRLKDLYLSTDMKASENPVQGFVHLQYSEGIYPKEVHTGLAKIRGRLKYAESASLSATVVSNFYDTNQATLTGVLAYGDYGHNGIDRGPLYRRTFWRKQAKDRNRWAGIASPSNTGLTNYMDSSSYATTLLNSMGCPDGKGPSVWAFGMTLGHTQSCKGTDAGREYMDFYSGFDFGELSTFRMVIGAGFTNFAGGGNGEWGSRKDRAYWQNGNNGILGSGSHKYYFSHPTVSAQYNQQDLFIFGRYHAENVNNSWFNPADDKYNPNGQNELYYPSYQDDFPHRFRTPAFAGKDPWFDSYEEYAQDIRVMGKDYSIIPEYIISNNMNYHVLQQGGNFRKQNDKFLNNAGASITESAAKETGGFNEDFFVTYAHTDFMKYLDVMVNDHDNIDTGINKITLKCKGIKKLLPYNGFYPVARTLQLASLFSQSYAPFIGGYKWQNGKPTETASHQGGNLSGALAVTALMQPFFAPGMLYNTIKAGIAMDYAVFTGSPGAGHGAGAATITIDSEPNYRLQFETLVDIKNGSGMGGVPLSASDGSKRIYWQGPEYLTGQAASESANRRDIFFDWNGGETSPLYKMAAHNFLAECINFFLEDSSLKVIKSRPSNRVKSMVSGNTYYMDVRMYRSDDVLMYGGRWNNTHKLIHSGNITGPDLVDIVPEYAGLTFTGKYFGHPFTWINTSAWLSGIQATHVGDSGSVSHFIIPSYADGGFAPYLPPYFYKDSVARISYFSDGTEKNQTDPISYVLSKVKVENFNDSLLDLLTFYNTGSVVAAKNRATWKAAMTLSSSVNLFGVSRGFKTSFDPKKIDSVTGRALINTVDETDATFNSWIISPKFECPIMNFRSQPDELYKVVHEDGSSHGVGTIGSSAVSGTGFPVTKGMWAGYGDFCTGSTGVFLSVEESYPDLLPSQRLITGSLIDIFGFDTTPNKLGEVATAKEISEAIVAIPFIDNQIAESGLASTVNIMGRNFFSITPALFGAQKSRKDAGEAVVKAGEYGGNKEFGSTSITNMIGNMSKYVIPPELNFLKFADIKPFVMYIFEFKHQLDQQDVADIWQGVMPKIAMTAEKDEVQVSHEMRPWEFFEGKKLPPQVRWMIFKVKRQASTNYFAKTADSKDDARFRFDFKVGAKVPEYSFNWPYDFCSLVELAKVEAEVDITPLPKNITGLKPIQNAGVLESIKDNGLVAQAAPINTSTSLVDRKDLLKQVSLPPVIKLSVFGRGRF